MFNYTQLMTEVKRFATEQGEHVYKKPENEDYGTFPCLYVHGRDTDKPEPGCIFGHAAMALGHEIQPYTEGQDASSLMDDMCISYDNAEVYFARSVQDSQDSGMAWGLAYEKAKRMTRENYPNFDFGNL